jgi:hypothetical protein
MVDRRLDGQAARSRGAILSAVDEGLLIRAPDSLSSIEEVDDFIALVYWSQRRRGGRLPLAVAEPGAHQR